MLQNATLCILAVVVIACERKVTLVNLTRQTALPLHKLRLTCITESEPLRTDGSPRDNLRKHLRCDGSDTTHAFVSTHPTSLSIHIARPQQPARPALLL